MKFLRLVALVPVLLGITCEQYVSQGNVWVPQGDCVGLIESWVLGRKEVHHSLVNGGALFFLKPGEKFEDLWVRCIDLQTVDQAERHSVWVPAA